MVSGKLCSDPACQQVVAGSTIEGTLSLPTVHASEQEWKSANPGAGLRMLRGGVELYSPVSQRASVRR
jgi:hypothetical protein